MTARVGAGREEVRRPDFRRDGRVPERVQQQHIVRLLRTLGAEVYVLGTVRRRGDYPGTMQSPGLPDLLAFLPRGKERRQVWIEVKASNGRLSPPQLAFREHCRGGGIEHIVGGVDSVIAWLVAEGYLRESPGRHGTLLPERRP